MNAGKKCSADRGSFTVYTLEGRAKIGKYTAKNGPARATRHLSVPEAMVRSLLGKSVKFEKLPIICTFWANRPNFVPVKFSTLYGRYEYRHYKTANCRAVR